MKRKCRYKDCTKGPLLPHEGTMHFSCWMEKQSRDTRREALKRLKRKQRRGGGQL